MNESKLCILASMSLVLIFLSFLRPLYSISCPEIEKQSLLSFKQSQNGSSNVLSSWDSKVDCCTYWEGVVCSNVTGHVLHLDLQDHDLGGKLNSSSLLNLKHLKYLDLSYNNFHEKIPSFIGSLTSLEYLDLSFAGFYGNIHHSIGNLSNLHVLSLAVGTSVGPQLEASSVEWLLGLSQLEHLNMNGVNLSKATNWAQQVISNLPSLVVLQLNHCNLKSIDPLNDVNNISRSNLATLDLSWNSLSNDIVPSWIFQLSNLQYLDLSGNELSGKIPREVASLCNIQILKLFGNNFGGEISDSFGNNMSECFLRTLEYLNLAWNQLSGHLPSQFGEFKRLRSLYLRGNSLSGVIPNKIGNLVSLDMLDLDNNKFTGNLPDSIGKLVNLTELYIGNNMLEGVVTESHFANLSNLDYLYASGNHLTLKVNPNWIPPFKLNELYLGSWHLESPFPLWLETQKASISSLDLSCTGIYGNIPSWLWSLSFLNLSHNQLDGKILSMSDGGHDHHISMFFDLSSNRFSGPLPQLMTTSILELHLSNNSFSGGLSEFLCINTSNVVLINFEGNHLSGELPQCFIKWKSLTVLNLGKNKLSGRIPNSIGFLTNLESLNLYGNSFSGHVPSSLKNCTNLVKIDFGDNNLGGDIPKWIDTRFFNLRYLIFSPTI